MSTNPPLAGVPGMWSHNCSREGEIFVGNGEECSWCGAKEPTTPKGWLADSFAKFLREQKGYDDEAIAAEMKANGLAWGAAA
jgi:hypothetical protein